MDNITRLIINYSHIPEIYDLLTNHDKNINQHIHKCILYLKKYPFLNEYIDEYLNIYPDLINMNIYSNFTLLNITCNIMKYNDYNKIVDILIKKNADLNIKNSYGETALINACNNHNYYVVKKLINAGADINLSDKNGCNALMKICCNLYHDVSYKIIKFLLKKGLDPNIKDKHGRHCIFYCVYNNDANINEKAFILILEKSIDIEIASKSFLHDDDVLYTPFLLAIKRHKKNPRIIGLFLEYYAKKYSLCIFSDEFREIIFKKLYPITISNTYYSKLHIESISYFKYTIENQLCMLKYLSDKIKNNRSILLKKIKINNFKYYDDYKVISKIKNFDYRLGLISSIHSCLKCLFLFL